MKKKFLADIIHWIEDNIDEKICSSTLENISGYTIRHLSNIFMQYTNLTPAKYIRQRKLCRAAFLLRLTNLKIMDIAYQLKFDSQQSFSREFSKLFGYSPRQYRKSREWDFKSLQLPIQPENVPEIKFEYCILESKKYHGYRFSFEQQMYFIRENETIIIYQKIIDIMRKYHSDLFISSTFSPHAQKDRHLIVNSFLGFHAKNDLLISTDEEFTSEDGKYIKFSFNGSLNEYIYFPRSVYYYLLPKLRLKRREGSDIEILKYIDTACPGTISCDYFIPVV